MSLHDALILLTDAKLETISCALEQTSQERDDEFDRMWLRR
jgi:hypothetical protein